MDISRNISMNYEKKLVFKSNEDTIYVLHAIIHQFYLKYPQWISEDANKHVNDIKNMIIEPNLKQF